MKIAESFILKFCFLVCRDQLFDDFGLKTVLFKDFIKCLRLPVSILSKASRWLHNTVGHHLILLWVLVPIRFSWRTFSRFSVLNLIRKIGESSKLIKKLTSNYPIHYSNMQFHIKTCFDYISWTNDCILLLIIHRISINELFKLNSGHGHKVNVKYAIL